MKKYPDDFVPSVVIQFFVFTAMFGLWLFVDLHYREGLNGVLTWIRDLPTLLQTPNFLWPLLFSSIVGNLVTMPLIQIDVVLQVERLDMAHISQQSEEISSIW